MRALVLLLCSLSASAAHGAATAQDRARVDYMLNCQGCHQPTGGGAEGVPALRDHLGYFLQVPGGREYVVQVPGVATSALDDEALANVLNWVLKEFSAAQLPSPFVPYSAKEVGDLRREPLLSASQERERLLRRIPVRHEPR